MNESERREAQPESAGSYMVQAVPTALPSATAGEVRATLPCGSFQHADCVIVVDEAGHAAGILPMGILATADATARLSTLMQDKFPVVRPETDQERVASLALEYGVTFVPVADDAGRFLGVIPTRALLS